MFPCPITWLGCRLFDALPNSEDEEGKKLKSELVAGLNDLARARSTTQSIPFEELTEKTTNSEVRLALTKLNGCIETEQLFKLVHASRFTELNVISDACVDCYHDLLNLGFYEGDFDPKSAAHIEDLKKVVATYSIGLDLADLQAFILIASAANVFGVKFGSPEGAQAWAEANSASIFGPEVKMYLKGQLKAPQKERVIIIAKALRLPSASYKEAKGSLKSWAKEKGIVAGGAKVKAKAKSKASSKSSEVVLPETKVKPKLRGFPGETEMMNFAAHSAVELTYEDGQKIVEIMLYHGIDVTKQESYGAEDFNFLQLSAAKKLAEVWKSEAQGAALLWLVSYHGREFEDDYNPSMAYINSTALAESLNLPQFDTVEVVALFLANWFGGKGDKSWLAFKDPEPASEVCREALEKQVMKDQLTNLRKVNDIDVQLKKLKLQLKNLSAERKALMGEVLDTPKKLSEELPLFDQ